MQLDSWARLETPAAIVLTLRTPVKPLVLLNDSDQSSFLFYLRYILRSSFLTYSNFYMPLTKLLWRSILTSKLSLILFSLPGWPPLTFLNHPVIFSLPIYSLSPSPPPQQSPREGDITITPVPCSAVSLCWSSYIKPAGTGFLKSFNDEHLI